MSTYSVDPLTGQVRKAGGAISNEQQILPVQALVNSLDSAGFIASLLTGSINLSNKGITSINGLWVANHVAMVAAAGLTPNFTFTGNAIVKASVDAVLLAVDLEPTSTTKPGTLTLNSAAIPTQNAAVVNGAGTVAVDGTYTPRGALNGKPFYTLIGQADSSTLSAISWNGSNWQIFDSSATSMYVSSEDVAAPWNVVTWVLDAGVDSVPVVTSTNANQANLVAKGWNINVSS